ncbi:hypothetical protein JST99_02220 [Candidatus Dependentiae bacterium]|nr:hypothetical protein [Candidatus Dependentiae bacterium]MCC7415039.1 hypothetical protein [Campylobacterota bacterium]
MNKIYSAVSLVLLTMTMQQFCTRQSNNISLAQQLATAQAKHKENDACYQYWVKERDAARAAGLRLDFYNEQVDQARENYNESNKLVKKLLQQNRETSSDALIAQELQQQEKDMERERIAIKDRFARMNRIDPQARHQLLKELNRTYNNSCWFCS